MEDEGINKSVIYSFYLKTSPACSGRATAMPDGGGDGADGK